MQGDEIKDWFIIKNHLVKLDLFEYYTTIIGFKLLKPD